MTGILLKINFQLPGTIWRSCCIAFRKVRVKLCVSTVAGKKEEKKCGNYRNPPSLSLELNAARNWLDLCQTFQLVSWLSVGVILCCLCLGDGLDLSTPVEARLALQGTSMSSDVWGWFGFFFFFFFFVVVGWIFLTNQPKNTTTKTNTKLHTSIWLESHISHGLVAQVLPVTAG